MIGAPMEKNRQDALVNEYREVANNFRQLTDIRFKLLVFLPAATALATVLKVEPDGLRGLVISLFGLATTIGLVIYSTRNDQFYGELIERASEIERILGLVGGTFSIRSTAYLYLRLFGIKLKVNHGTGIGIIYASTILLWLFEIYLPLVVFIRQIFVNRGIYFSSSDTSTSAVAVTSNWAQIIAALLALLSTYFALQSVKHQKNIRQQRIRELAASAVSQLSSLERNKSALDSRFVSTCAELSGAAPDKIKARADFYGSLDARSLSHYMPIKPEALMAAHFVALLTDLPPRWIFDYAATRREKAAATQRPNGSPKL
jgi:hypothetical protein